MHNIPPDPRNRVILDEGNLVPGLGPVDGEIVGVKRRGFQLMNAPLNAPPSKPLWTSRGVQLAVVTLLLAGSFAVWKYYQRSNDFNTLASTPIPIPAQEVGSSVPFSSRPISLAEIDNGRGHPNHMYKIAIPAEVLEACNAAMKAAGTLEIDGIPECETPDIPPVVIK